MHERVRFIRKENGLSQDEFAKRLGITRSMLSNIELDRLANPEQKMPIIKLIAKEFRVSERWLLTGEGQKEEETSDLARLIVDIKTGKNPFAAKYIDFLASLSDEEWEVFEKQTAIMKRFYDELD